MIALVGRRCVVIISNLVCLLQTRNKKIGPQLRSPISIVNMRLY